MYYPLRKISGHVVSAINVLASVCVHMCMCVHVCDRGL